MSDFASYTNHRFIADSHTPLLLNKIYIYIYRKNSLPYLLGHTLSFINRVISRDLDGFNPLNYTPASCDSINSARASYVFGFVLLNVHLFVVANRIKQHFHNLILWIAQYVQCGNTFLIFICLCPFIFVGFVTLLIRFTLKFNLGGGADRK